MTPRIRGRVATTCLLVAIASGGSPAHAQPAPAPIASAGIDERLGSQLPLDATFTAPGLGEVALRRVIEGERPVLLVLAYARCTMLCSLVLRGVVKLARALERAPGDGYQLVLVSLDDRETLDEATRKQAALLADVDRGATAMTWPYLVGARASIDAVATALGFRYAWDPRTEQYAHPAVIFALTPDGRVARYLHGVEFAPDEVAAALADAAAGRLVTTATADVLRCFRFDPATRRAGARVERFLRFGAAALFLLLLSAIVLLVMWERKRGGES